MRNQPKEKKEKQERKNGNILKAFSIALRNRYQVLEDEGLAIKGEDEEIECDFQHVQEWKPHQ